MSVSVAVNRCHCNCFDPTPRVSAGVVPVRQKPKRRLPLNNRSLPRIHQSLYSSCKVSRFHGADLSVALVPAAAPGHIAFYREAVLYQMHRVRLFALFLHSLHPYGLQDWIPLQQAHHGGHPFWMTVARGLQPLF